MRAGDVFTAIGTPFATTAMASADFETYSESGYRWDAAAQKWAGLPGTNKTKRGLEVVGAKRYINDPSFEVLTLSYDLLDDFGKRRWKPGDPAPLDLHDHVAAGKPLKGWNSGGFEYTVWNDYCVPKFGWPPLCLEQLYDTMAHARASALPGALANAADVLNLTNRKDADGKRLLDIFSKPRKPTKKDPSLRIVPSAAPAEFERLQIYCDRDVTAEIEAGLHIPDLTPYEREVWLTDQRINHRGMQIDLEGVENCIAIVEQAEAKYNAELREITNGAVCAATELPALKTWLHTRGVHLDNAQAETIEAELERMVKLRVPPADPCRRALEIRVALGSASIKKLYSFRNQQVGGRLYGLYSYHNAHPGRWAGMGPQPQNLPRGGRFATVDEVEQALAVIALRSLSIVETVYGDALDTIANCLRGLIIAAPGHDLICSDFSAIEAVGAAMLAGEQWRIDVFRTHGKIYEMGASKITGIPFEEFLRHKKETGKHHPMRQGLGKVSELASIYAGWIPAWKRFGADEFMSDPEIKEAILAWRRESPMVVEAWGGQTRDKFDRYRKRQELYGLEGAAVAAVQSPGTAFAYRSAAFQMYGDVLYFKLPSGRIITYHAPRLTPSTRDYAEPWEQSLSYEGWNNNAQKGPIGWIRMDLYGGVLMNNWVQGACRDLQAGALVRIEKAGYRPMLHTHDEPCGEVPRGFGSIEEFEALMAFKEPWAADWPINVAGGFRGPRYGKFEDADSAVRHADR